MSLPVTATLWSYVFGAICMGVSSLYYLPQPEKYSVSFEARSMHTCTYIPIYVYVYMFKYTHTHTHTPTHTQTQTHTHTHTIQ